MMGVYWSPPSKLSLVFITMGYISFVVICHFRNKRKREDDHNVHRGKTQRTRKNKKDTELKNFYRFQIKEQKMKQLDILRKKFEEDKEKVAKMKDARKFKPY